MKKIVTKTTLCFLAITLILVSSCKKDNTAPTPKTPVTPVVTTTTTTTPTVTFLSRDQLFTTTGYWSQGFILSETRNFVLFGVAQYAADIVVIDQNQFNNFSNGLSYTKLAGWFNGAGYISFSLPAGSYYLCIKNNNTTGSNRCVAKLDYAVSLPSSDNCSFINYPVQETQILQPGQLIGVPFNYDFGYRYFIDGCNTNLDQYIMTDLDYNLLQGGNAFQYVTAYSGLNNLNPGFWELNTGLLIGNVYYVVFKNNTSSPQSFSALMEKWKRNY